jgi:hypothetical protein
MVEVSSLVTFTIEELTQKRARHAVQRIVLIAESA